MTDAKYSIAIEAVNKFTVPFKAYEKVNDKLSAQLKGQQAELRNLKTAQRDLSGFDRLKRKTGEAAISLDDAKISQQELSVELEKANKKSLGLGSSFEKARLKTESLKLEMAAAKKPTEELSLSFEQAKLRQKNLTEKMKRGESASKRLTNSYERAKIKTAGLNAEYQRQASRLKSVEGRLESAGLDANKFSESQKKIERSTEKATAALSAQQAKLKTLGAAQAKVKANRAARSELRGQVLETAALAYVAAKPVQAAISYDSSMTEVSKYVDFKDKDAENNFGSEILKLTESRPNTSQELLAIAAEGGKSKLVGAELQTYIKSASQTAIAFDLSARDAAAGMSTLKDNLNISWEKTRSVTDAINHLGDNMESIESKNIFNIMAREGAVAKNAGLSSVDTAAFSAVLYGAVGRNEERASTALKNISISMALGESAPNSKKRAWDELGFDSAQVAYDMSNDAKGTILSVLDAFKDVSPERVLGLSTQLFDREVAGAMQSLIANTGKLKSAFESVGDEDIYKGSVKKEDERLMEAASKRLTKVGNSFGRLSTVMGGTLLPVVLPVAEGLGSTASYMADLAEGSPKVAAGLSLAVGGFVAFKTASLAFRMVGLTIGQGANMIGLGRAKLSATTASTATNANLAAGALTRMNMAMRATAAGGFGGGRGGKGRKGKRGRGASGLATGAVAAGAVSSKLPFVGKMAGSLRGVGGALSKPLNVALMAPLLMSAVSAGDSESTGSVVGNMAGGMGGAMAGAAAGAALGSIVPFVGTAIGGIVGGIAGGMGGSFGGEWLGGEVGSWFSGDEPVKNRLPSPEAIQKQIASQDNRSIVFSPNITIPPSSGNFQDDKRLVDMLMARMKNDLAGVMGGDDLAVRLDGSLSDMGGA